MFRSVPKKFTFSARVSGSASARRSFTLYSKVGRYGEDTIVKSLQILLDGTLFGDCFLMDAQTNSLVCVRGISVPNYSLSSSDQDLWTFYDWCRSSTGYSIDQFDNMLKNCELRAGLASSASSVAENSDADENSSADEESSNDADLLDNQEDSSGDEVVNTDEDSSADEESIDDDYDRAVAESLAMAAATTTATSTASSSTSSTSSAPQSSTEETKPTCYDILKKFGRETSLPAFCNCPITMIPFNDPIVVSSGHTFERSALQEYYDSLPNHPKKFPCPVTRVILDKNELKLPAHIVTKNMVEHFTNAVVKEEEAKKKMTEVVTEKQEAVSTASSSQLSVSTQSISTDSDKQLNENEKEELREKRVQFFSRASSETQSTPSNASGAEANTNMRRRNNKN